MFVALERHGRRQHDVGVTCHRRPECVVHDEGLGPAERTAQASQMLVVERVAAAPVHQADVGIGQPLTVEVDGLPRP
jgi:hypothetical protein